MDPAVAYLTVGELAAAIRRRSLSSEETVSLHLDRIAASELNAFVTVDADAALARARDLDRHAARSRFAGPLHGVPVTVKDSIATRGLRTTGGSSTLAAHVPADDAPAVARLRAAGAVVIGKTNLPAWSMDIQTYNDVAGVTVNPWDANYTPGGSSGGSAAAVAAGLSPLDLGADIGGSIRIPAHFCGVYGLKPSYGLIPSSGYVDRPVPVRTELDINVFGPLARHPDDLGLALDVLRVDASVRARWEARLGPVPDRRLRVGLWLDDPGCVVDREYLRLLHRFADGLSAHADVDDSHPPVDFTAQWQLYRHLGFSAVGHAMPEAWHDAHGSHRDWLAAREQRARFAETWRDWFDRFDVLITPVLAVPHLRRDETGSFADRVVTVDGITRPHDDLIAWCGLTGLLGLPSVVVPIGRTASGLPCGAQLVAGHLCDTTALALASTCATTGLSSYLRPQNH